MHSLNENTVSVCVLQTNNNCYGQCNNNYVSFYIDSSWDIKQLVCIDLFTQVRRMQYRRHNYIFRSREIEEVENGWKGACSVYRDFLYYNLA